MLKVFLFSYISVLLIIANVIIAEGNNCVERISLSKACLKNASEETDHVNILRCSYRALELISEDDQYIVPRTKNEEVLIPLAKRFEECLIQLLSPLHDDTEEKNSGENIKPVSHSKNDKPCDRTLYPALRVAYAASYNCSLPGNIFQ